MITESPTRGDVPLVHDGTVADIYVDETDADVVGIAATDLRDDIERVTGERPAVVDSLDELSGHAVVVGTLGNSKGVAASDVDIDSLRDERESFVVATVPDGPTPDVESCVLIVGSDRRGTAYGAYELSKRIGVSPWYWWADVEPADRDVVAVGAESYADGPPSVAYRGIFLNDEDFGLRPWASETFAPEDAENRPGIGPKTYARIFELLLRLKANTIWPAMHPDTRAFFRYDEHAELADRYAIVVGTSHCEPMHRNNVDEWEVSPEEWNYATNRNRIREYWRTRVEDVAEYENVFTIGMRGIHDSGMPGGDTREETVALLQQVLDDQRQMLDKAHDRSSEEIPQVFCPYKEVLDLYRKGLDVPEDVCLMWPDDSHGYIRELPTESERERAGGSGIYYHLSYWGRPHDYLWLSSVPPGLIKQEMTKAYDAGARECWVVNVGDIKPTEKEMEFFLDLAWDIEAVRSEPVSGWLSEWAAREFGDSHAEEIAEILAEYYRLSQARKPEHMGWSTVYPNTQPDEPAFSVVHAGDEARRRVDAFTHLVDRAEAVHDALSSERRPSFYELVLYQVRCGAAMTEKFLHAARSRRYAGQGRVAADRYADLAEQAHERIGTETRYYNEDLLDGKWSGMMSERPRDLPVFDEPNTARITPNDGTTLGIVPEGHHTPVRGDEGHPPMLPSFHAHLNGDRERFVDVYARDTDPMKWTVETSHDWIEIDETAGTVTDERRLWVSIDWETVPKGRTVGELAIVGPGMRKSVGVKAVAPPGEPETDFVEVDGAVAIEAEQYSRAAAGASGDWKRCEVPGRISGATVATDLCLYGDSSTGVDAAPRLEYDLELVSTGEIEIEIQCIPTQAINEQQDLRYVVVVDDDDPETVSIDPEGGEHDPEWQRNVLRGAAIRTTSHDVDNSGEHTLRLWGLDPGLIIDRIVVYTDGERTTYLGPRGTAVDDTL